jgi:hypothetical protein
MAALGYDVRLLHCMASQVSGRRRSASFADKKTPRGAATMTEDQSGRRLVGRNRRNVKKSLLRYVIQINITRLFQLHYHGPLYATRRTNKKK